MAITNSNPNFPTPIQVPNNSILDQYNRQTYLGNAFAVSNSGLSLANTNETPVFLMTNTSTTKSLFVNLRRYSSSAQAVLVKTYIDPTVSTTGTAATPVNLRPANPNTSISTCYKNGQFTVSANGSQISGVGVSNNYIVTQDNSLLVILDPGQTLLITAAALSANTLFNYDISWYEL